MLRMYVMLRMRVFICVYGMYVRMSAHGCMGVWMDGLTMVIMVARRPLVRMHV